MKKIKYILGAALIVSPFGAQAQKLAKDSTLNRTVVVEQEYNPDILDAAKVNVLPRVEVPAVNKKEVEYDVTLAPAKEIPLATMQAYTGKETPPKALPGYARLGYGNYGNLDAHTNYLLKLSAKDRLNLTFHMDGMNGKLDRAEPWTTGWGENLKSEKEWNSYYYRTSASIDYLHNFRKVDLNLGGTFGLSNFNFLSHSIDKKQKFTPGDIRLGIKSTADDLPLQFKAETNLLFYERQHDFQIKNAKETIVRTLAEVTGRINDEQQVAISFQMNNVFYKNLYYKEKDNFHRYTPYPYYSFYREIPLQKEFSVKNYTSVELNPYYHFENGDWRLHLGAHVDIKSAGNKKLRVAPDLKIQYTLSDNYLFYVQAIGGRRVNDFRSIEKFSPYVQLINPITYTIPMEDTYERVNSAIGFKASPVDNLWLHLYGGGQILEDDLFQLPISIDYLNQGNILDLSSGLMLTMQQRDTRNLYWGVGIDYSYKDIVNFSASISQHNWKTKKSDENPDSRSGTNQEQRDLKDYVFAFKPIFEGKTQISVRPFSPMLIQLGYQYTSRKKLTGGKRMDPVNNLYLSGNYDLFKGISVYARINNLLNKNYQYYWGYMNEGINFVGGVSFQF